MNDLSPNFTIPYSRYLSFYDEWVDNEEWQEHLRFGQAFYNYLDLGKMTQTPFHDKLYNEVYEYKVLDYIDEVMDYAN